MELLIISDMAHYIKNGQIVGWGPTVQEIDALTEEFDSIRHIGCLHAEEAPGSAMPYKSDKVSLVPLPVPEGEGLLRKWHMIRLIPLYAGTMLRELAKADIVHVRCPAFIPLIAIVLLFFMKHPKYRWVKYAGNWQPERRGPWSYALQRWLLRHNFARALVTVNGKWPDQPEHIFPFYNPSFNEKFVHDMRQMMLNKQLALPYYLIFVGAVNKSKGVDRVIKIAKELNDCQVNFELHILGDGPESPSYQHLARENGIGGRVFFHGWLPKNELSAYYEKAHFLLLPSDSEGWPKVISEALVFGVVPVSSSVSCIPQTLNSIGSGKVCPVDDIAAYVDALLSFINSPEEWHKAKARGLEAGHLFTYRFYIDQLHLAFQKNWGVAYADEVHTHY